MSSRQPGATAPLEAFFVTHHSRLLNFTISRTGDLHLAEDLVSQTYTIFLDRNGRDDGVVEWAWNKQALFEFCCKTVKFLLANWRARHGNRKAIPMQAMAPRQLQSAFDRTSEAGLACHGILNGLDESDRELLTARFIEDVSYEVLADRLGATVSATRQRVCRALQRARRSGVGGTTPPRRSAGLRAIQPAIQGFLSAGQRGGVSRKGNSSH